MNCDYLKETELKREDVLARDLYLGCSRVSYRSSCFDEALLSLHIQECSDRWSRKATAQQKRTSRRKTEFAKNDTHWSLLRSIVTISEIAHLPKTITEGAVGDTRGWEGV